jgi:alkylation response protein AidB-like acyl-CoA dehydrogenase
MSGRSPPPGPSTASSGATVSRSIRQAHPGPEGSLVRLYYSELNQRIHRLAMDVLGADALRGGAEIEGHPWSHDYLDSFGRTIGVGTKEIQKNIIGERVLGLPRGPR